MGMEIGRQEDAHEFWKKLRCSLCESTFSAIGVIPSSLDYTTPVDQIFRGFMHQELICVNCYNPVEKIDFFQELTVELADCVPNALQKYFSLQELQGANMLFCKYCDTLQPGTTIRGLYSSLLKGKPP